MANQVTKIPMGINKEVAKSRSGNRLSFASWQIDDYNPDSLIKGKQGGLKVYQDMVSDPRVKSALLRLKAEVLLPEFEVRPWSDNPADITIADFVRENLENTGTPWQDIMWSLLDFLNVGLTLAEIVMEPFGGRWVLKDIKSKDPNSFILVQDEFRNVTAVKVDGMNGMRIPYEKFVHIAWQSVYGNPYGTSHLKSAYVYYWALKTLWKARLMFCERFGEPFIIGQTPEEIDDTAESQFWDDLKSLHTDGVIKLPTGYTIDIREASSKGEIFEETTKALERNVVIAILGSHLQFEEGSAGNLGGASASSVHAEGSSLLVDMIRDRLLSGIQCLIKRLVDWNFGPQKTYPYPDFSKEEQKTYQDIAAERLRLEIYERLTDRGVDVPIDQVAEELGVPPMTPESGPLERASTPQGSSDMPSLPFAQRTAPPTSDVEELAKLEEVGRNEFYHKYNQYRESIRSILKKKTMRKTSYAVSTSRRRLRT